MKTRVALLKTSCANYQTLVPSKIQTEKKTIKTLKKSKMNQTIRGSSLNTLSSDLTACREETSILHCTFTCFNAKRCKLVYEDIFVRIIRKNNNYIRIIGIILNCGKVIIVTLGVIKR